MFAFFGVLFVAVLLFLAGFVCCLWAMYSFYPAVFKELVKEIKAKDMENYDKILKDDEGPVA